jgi:hypothetical protein
VGILTTASCHTCSSRIGSPKFFEVAADFGIGVLGTVDLGMMKS